MDKAISKAVANYFCASFEYDWSLRPWQDAIMQGLIPERIDKNVARTNEKMLRARQEMMRLLTPRDYLRPHYNINFLIEEEQCSNEKV